MDDIISVCTENNISYFLGGGSALGAIRHKGFIPWDDDIDINMPRQDFERFIPIFINKFNKKYAVQTPQLTKDYPLSLAKIRKRNTVLKGRDDLLSTDNGVGIDIFVIENTFDNSLLRLIHGFISLILGYLLSCRKFYRDRNYWTNIFKDIDTDNKAIKIKITIGFFVSWVSVTTLSRLTDRWHKICKNNNTKWVCGPAGRLHFFGELYEREKFCVTRQECFEGRSVNVPIEVEKYLEHCYGDWKTIPDKENIEKHIILEISI